ncbi:MAG: hypothetical protein HUJ22_12070 [Gracilimonas sp.]|nr:hypothetical protein [Gracilimonas sp.]
MKDVNLSEDTIQKTEILMNSARQALFITIVLFGMLNMDFAYGQTSDLTGPVTAEEIVEQDRIFEIYINRYKPDEKAVEYLSTQQDSVTLYVFFGNWCRESKKYIPGLMKSLKLANTSFIQPEYIGVDIQKKIPESFLKKFEIKYIPTVVVLKGDVELGRIEEKPHQLIETDLVQILKGNEK